MFLPGRPQISDKKLLHKVRESLLIDWLSEWKYSTLPICSAFLGIDYRSNRALFRTLEDRNIIASSPLPGTYPLKLVSLGKAGIETLLDPLRRKELNRLAKAMGHGAYLHHDLTAQIYALRFLHSAVELVADRRAPNSRHRPDVILVSGRGGFHAVEVETSQKYDERIFYNYLKYRSLIRKGDFKSVSFVFTSEQIMKHYLDCFNRRSWPLVTLTSSRNYRTLGEKVEPFSDEYQGLAGSFGFELINTFDSLFVSSHDLWPASKDIPSVPLKDRFFFE